MNSCTLENYLQVVVPHLSPKLVSPEALSHIQAITRIFPLSSEGLFECRLGANNSRVDFSVLATNLGSSHQSFEKLDFLVNLPEVFSSNPIWRRIQNFCSACCGTNSLLSNNIDNIWLEFDLDKDPQNLPIPSLFLGFKELNSEKYSIQISQSANEQLQTVKTALHILFDDHVSPIIENNLGICVNSLPQGSQILYVGVMFSRHLDAVRVNISGISPEYLEDYLAQIGWKYSIEPLKEIIQSLTQIVDTIILNIDIGTSIFPQLGLECLLNNKSTRCEPKWQLLLNCLVEHELCTPEKYDAVLNWSGYCHAQNYPELWPDNLIKVSQFLGSRWHSIYFRNLNHIKINYHPDGYLEAKGYLAFGRSLVCK
ncbi:hypothetical protein H6G80_25790 [Nostoc sp. FACHB-87]|uniref:hypothetical protein n=1 Tax=Nostocales TaxID=1161 RepID=UPI0016877F99|nr:MULTISPECIES: hypothetical protein [Nostocales]MBD2299675.1 hypothetical protein [Nostoc sp. FACHB-190]MBD2457477.1 hypothetical protein [Nostoc sp. FACHB-87]MBD2477555.1 hypothetical protein [Anabaena sp. FACHB-83]MBD2489582.1 hypothetical protein [Aulosira sp. FACHB-615]